MSKTPEHTIIAHITHSTLTYDTTPTPRDPLQLALDTGKISFRRYKALKAAEGTICPECHETAPGPNNPNLLQCACGSSQITNAALADLHTQHPTNKDLATRIRGRVWEHLTETNPTAWDALITLDDMTLFTAVLRDLPDPA